MSNGMYDQEWAPKVTVPVRRVGENWEFFYGGDVPARDGAIGDLIINASQITDKIFLAMVIAETIVKIFNQGTRLLVALSDQSARGARVGNLPWPDVPFENVLMGTTRFEHVVIGPPKPPGSRQQELIAKVLDGGLWLRLKELERSELECSTVILPEGRLKPARSVSIMHSRCCHNAMNSTVSHTAVMSTVGSFIRKIMADGTHWPICVKGYACVPRGA